MGAYQSYHVEIGDTKVAVMDYNPRGRKTYRVGDAAYLSFDQGNAHVL
jgi:iron(III) transport system ATP-binding protein